MASLRDKHRELSNEELKEEIKEINKLGKSETDKKTNKVEAKKKKRK